MKKLVYKNICGDNPRKSEISIEEISDWTRSEIARKWIRKYFIKEKYTSDDTDALREWVEIKKLEGCRRDCHVLRQFNTRTGENKIICKILGDIFVISGTTAYRIVYVNELRIKTRDVRKNKRGV